MGLKFSTCLVCSSEYGSTIILAVYLLSVVVLLQRSLIYFDADYQFQGAFNPHETLSIIKMRWQAI
jgi:hypothetical protein